MVCLVQFASNSFSGFVAKLLQYIMDETHQTDPRQNDFSHSDKIANDTALERRDSCCASRSCFCR